MMEGATNERAARLTATLNGALQQLSAQLEGAVNEALQVCVGVGGGGGGRVIGCVCGRGGGEGVLCPSFGGGVAQESRIGHTGGVSFGGEEAAAE